jgi:hypothetical protein
MFFGDCYNYLPYKEKLRLHSEDNETFFLRCRSIFAPGKGEVTHKRVETREEKFLISCDDVLSRRAGGVK